MLPLVPVELVVVGHVVVGGQQEAAGAAGGVANGVAGPGTDHVHHGLDEGTGREILARA